MLSIFTFHDIFSIQKQHGLSCGSFGLSEPIGDECQTFPYNEM